jgi:rubrerythrin
MLSTIYYNKEVEKHYQNLKYNKLNSNNKKHFLICECCYWMATTLPYPLDYPLNRYKKCPICKNKVDIFSIPPSF